MKPTSRLLSCTALLGALLLGIGIGHYTKNTGFPKDGSNHRDSETDLSKARSSQRMGTSPNNRQKPHQLARSNTELEQGMATLIAELKKGPVDYLDYDGSYQAWHFIRQLSEDEIFQVLASVGEIGNTAIRSNIKSMLLKRLAQLNGKAAMQTVLEKSQLRLEMPNASGVFASWIKNNPKEAIAWYEDNRGRFEGQGMHNSYHLGSIFREIARNDFDQAMNLASTIPDFMDRRQAMQNIAQIAISDPSKLSKLYQYLDADAYPGYKNLVMKLAVADLVGHAPESAKAYIATIQEPDEKNALVKQIAEKMSYSQPRAAIEYGMEQSSDISAKKDFMNSQIASWALMDSVAATEWYESQPSDIKNDQAVINVARTLHHRKNFKQAFLWLDRGGNSDAIIANRKQIYEQWLKTDPEAAKEWAAGAGKETMRKIEHTSPATPN
ncbi:hypothetical protein NT6N_31840 [Oceaniferula spumae]|uniref:DUF4034 domain-containing protein n=1 Tax=Oceaniferula spumae TaxID=2979115 RepID=A0AAT9FQF4_9BACT